MVRMKKLISRVTLLALIIFLNGFGLAQSTEADADVVGTTSILGSDVTGIETTVGTTGLAPAQATYEKRAKLHSTDPEGGLPLFWIIAIGINLLFFGLFVVWAIGQWRSHDR